MKSIPKNLWCLYCLENITHGGKCTGKKTSISDSGCDDFIVDERGCILSGDYKVPVKIYSDIPQINEWCNNYGINGFDIQIRIRNIYGLDWDKSCGLLYINCNIDYFINEFNDDYRSSENKFTLKIIKGGK